MYTVYIKYSLANKLMSICNSKLNMYLFNISLNKLTDSIIV